MYIIDEQTRRFGRLLHYAGVLITVVSVSTGFSLLHAPAVQAITETSNRIDELMLSVQNAPAIRQQHQVISNKLHEVTTRIANVQRRVPREADSSEFINQVTQIADEENVAIKEFTPGRPETKNGYGELQVTLKSEGSFGSICTFVDHLSKLSRLSKIKDLTLTSETDATEYPMTATLVIYFGIRGSDSESAPEGRNG
jgi:Tfp pilus assembly protein PilO